MPARCSRCDSISPAGPAPMMPTWVFTALQPDLTQLAKRGICGGDSAVDRLLQQDFLQVVGGEPVLVDRRPRMHPELLPSSQRDERAEHQHPPRPDVEARPA